MALADILRGVLQQVPSVPCLLCACVCEHPGQALLHGPMHVLVRLRGGTGARVLPVLPAAHCPR